MIHTMNLKGECILFNANPGNAEGDSIVLWKNDERMSIAVYSVGTWLGGLDMDTEDWDRLVYAVESMNGEHEEE